MLWDAWFKKIERGHWKRRRYPHRRAGLQLRCRRGNQEHDRAHRKRMGRQDRRLPLRGRRPRELYVSDGVRKQSHARFSLRYYSKVRVCHIPCFRRRAHERQKSLRANQTGRRRTRSLHQSASKLNAGLASDCQETSHAIQLCLELTFEGAIIRRARLDIAKLRLKFPFLHGEIRPTNDALAPKQWHRVIAELAFRRRRISLETVRPAPQQFEAVALPHNWIEGSQ